MLTLQKLGNALNLNNVSEIVGGTFPPATSSSGKSKSGKNKSHKNKSGKNKSCK
jgi:hypothetical protein